MIAKINSVIMNTIFIMAVMSKSDKIAKSLDAVSRALNLKAARIKVNIRDMQRIYLRKQGDQ